MPFEQTKVLQSCVALIAISLILQILSALFIPPLFFIRVDIVGVPLVLAFFLFRTRYAFLTLVAASILIAFFAPLGGPFGAFMKFMATGSMIAALALITHTRGINKTEFLKRRGLALFTFLLAVFIRGFLMVMLYFYVTPIFFSAGDFQITTEWLVDSITSGLPGVPMLSPLLLAFIVIFLINAIIAALDFGLAWLLAFKFKMVERFGTW
jgi:riboflavin transporter FmnP